MNLNTNHRIGIKYGMSGYFAIHYAEFSDDGGKTWYTDVVSTGTGRYRGTDGFKKACEEAKKWSEAESIRLSI